MNKVTANAILIKGLQHVVENAVYQVQDLENRIRNVTVCSDADKVAEYEIVAQTIYDNVKDDLSSMLKTKVSVYVVTYRIEEYPDLLPGSILINGVAYCNTSETFVPFDTVKIESIDPNCIQQLI